VSEDGTAEVELLLVVKELVIEELEDDDELELEEDNELEDEEDDDVELEDELGVEVLDVVDWMLEVVDFAP